MIDFHCHLDLYPNVMSFLNEVERRNKFTLVVTTSPRAWMATSKVFKGFHRIECAIGLHPMIVTEKFKEKDLLLENIKYCRFVGEVGIDGSDKYIGSLENQVSLFQDVIRKADSYGGRILSIHSRKAESKIIEIIENSDLKNIPILHWYTGGKTVLKRAINANCFFSIGPAMVSTTKSKNLIPLIPINRILPESDGPFAQINGKPIYPWEAMDIVPYLADIYSVSKERVTCQLIENCQTILKSKLYLRELNNK